MDGKDKNSLELTLIRHSLTEGNVKRWCYGRTDLPLIAEGFELIERRKSEGVYPSPEGKRLYTSGLLRTEQTLRAMYGEKVEFETMPLLREFDFGDFECKSHEELSAEDPRYIEWLSGDYESAPTPGGESYGSFRRRVMRGYSELLERGEDAVLIIHGGTISAGLKSWFGEAKSPKGKTGRFNWVPEPAGGYTVRFTRDGKGLWIPESYELF